MEIERKSDNFPRDIFKSTSYFFYQKILKDFNDFPNQNFLVLWLKGTQTMKMKQNQVFFHDTCSNLTSYIFSSKNIKITFKSRFS